MWVFSIRKRGSFIIHNREYISRCEETRTTKINYLSVRRALSPPYIIANDSNEYKSRYIEVRVVKLTSLPTTFSEGLQQSQKNYLTLNRHWRMCIAYSVHLKKTNYSRSSRLSLLRRIRVALFHCLFFQLREKIPEAVLVFTTRVSRVVRSFTQSELVVTVV